MEIWRITILIQPYFLSEEQNIFSSLCLHPSHRWAWPTGGHAHVAHTCARGWVSAVVRDSRAATTARSQSHDLLGWLIRAASHMRVSTATELVCYHNVCGCISGSAVSLPASWCLCCSRESARRCLPLMMNLLLCRLFTGLLWPPFIRLTPYQFAQRRR